MRTAPDRNEARKAAARFRSVATRSGRRGCWTFRSTTTNSTMSTTPAAMKPQASGASQPCSALVKPYTRDPRPRAARMTPGQSYFVDPWALLSLTSDQTPSERDDGDRHVHEEAPAPAHVFRQEPAQQDAGGGTDAGDGAEDRERRAAVLAARKGDGQERQRRGGQQCGEHTLQGAGADQLPRLLRDAAEQGRGGKADGGHDEGPLAAPEIRDPSAKQQEGAEGQGVGRDHPGTRRVTDAHLDLETRQRQVHDRAVEHHHKLREGQEHQRPPAASGPAPLLYACICQLCCHAHFHPSK